MGHDPKILTWISRVLCKRTSPNKEISKQFSRVVDYETALSGKSGPRPETIKGCEVDDNDLFQADMMEGFGERMKRAANFFVRACSFA